MAAADHSAGNSPRQAPPTLEEVRRLVHEDAEAADAQVRSADRVPDALVAQVADVGLLRLTVPADSGGFGLDTPDYQRYLEAAATGPGWLRMLVHVCNGFWRPLMRFGTEQQRRVVADMAAGKTYVAFALTERAGGTGRDLHSTAVRDGGHWRISGEKHLITFADRADYFLLTAATDDRRAADSLTTFLVPRDSPGLHIDAGQHTMGLAGTGHGVLTFSEMPVPDEARLGEVGEGLAVGLSFLDYSRISLATCMVGLAQRCLDEAIHHTQQRRTFGRPISERQAVQVRLAQMQTDIAAGRALAHEAGMLHQAGGPLTEVAATAKLFCQQMVGRVTDHGLQLHGGFGYTTDAVMERLYTDARGFWFEEGTAEIQQMVIARSLLAGRE